MDTTLTALLKVLTPDTMVVMGVNYGEAMKNKKHVDVATIMAYDEMKKEYYRRTKKDLSLAVHNAIKLKAI